jgi:hypothetical protein
MRVFTLFALLPSLLAAQPKDIALTNVNLFNGVDNRTPNY